jgi:hypothetical protein
VEYLIRQARITDVDRLAAIGRGTMPRSGSGSLDAADLLRQLVYLPNASLLVAEMRREIVGGATIRKSTVPTYPPAMTDGRRTRSAPPTISRRISATSRLAFGR